ncbi:fused MFS/spermidine synthase [Aquabacterium sp. CECT 9606]|uniref:fused MFS/spermidine synthase n=1 Tax=Aquabacterium sp. CECT 9606 TaxID=2845822 RepID=UPI001E488F90|nr:fused MFS/spermidine synthase [Aquabacterium sp. CECT 9606]CAH0355695.1 Polyamine aminopropyltransferase [Aquabacterium sp. CECT 9606]
MSKQSPSLHKNRQTLSLSLDSPLLQSCMRRDDPTALILDYTRAMMGFLPFNPSPRSILMIGLGGGSVPKYCHQHLPDTDITTVEISAEVIALRDEFMIPADSERFRVICADGAAFVAQATQCHDVLMVDGFTGEGQPEALCSRAFYDACRAALTDEGLLVVNLHAEMPRCGELTQRIERCFGGHAVSVATDDGDNRVVLAGSGTALARTARAFEQCWASLSPAHQKTLGACSTRIERALIKRYPVA